MNPFLILFAFAFGIFFSATIYPIFLMQMYRLEIRSMLRHIAILNLIWIFSVFLFGGIAWVAWQFLRPLICRLI